MSVLCAWGGGKGGIGSHKSGNFNLKEGKGKEGRVGGTERLPGGTHKVKERGPCAEDIY